MEAVIHNSAYVQANLHILPLALEERAFLIPSVNTKIIYKFYKCPRFSFTLKKMTKGRFLSRFKPCKFWPCLPMTRRHQRQAKEPGALLKMDIPKEPLLHGNPSHLTALLHHIITETNPPRTEVLLAQICL